MKGPLVKEKSLPLIVLIRFPVYNSMQVLILTVRVIISINTFSNIQGCRRFLLEHMQGIKIFLILHNLDNRIQYCRHRIWDTVSH